MRRQKQKLQMVFYDIFSKHPIKNIIECFVKELLINKISIEIVWLNKTDNTPYSDLLELMILAPSLKKEKITHVKNQDFENAAKARDKEKEVLQKIEDHNLDIYYYKGNPLLIKVIVNEETNNVTLEILTFSIEAVEYLKNIIQKYSP